MNLENLRLIENIIQLGLISQTDLSTGRARVKIGELETDFLPFATGRAGKNISWSAPEIGEQVIVIAPSGILEQAVIGGSIYQSAFPMPSDKDNIHMFKFSDGAEFTYDTEGKHLIAKLPSGGKMTISADGGMQITGDMTVTGDVTVTGKIHATDDIKGDKNITDKKRSMQADRGIYNSHKHEITKPAVLKAYHQ